MSMTNLRTGYNKRQISDDLGTVAKRQKNAQPELHGLASLPEEILLLIIDHLMDSLVRSYALQDVLQHLKALRSLCLTSWKFNRLATPYLCAFVSNRNRRKVPQILDAMILDSRKASSIRYISWALEVNRSSQAICRRSPTARTMFFKNLGRLGIPELAAELRDCFDGSSPEDHLATALVLARNLEYLEAADVTYRWQPPGETIWRPAWLQLLTISALSSPPGLAQHFRHLHHLHLSMDQLDFEQICPLLRLPAIRTLHLTNGEHGGDVWASRWNEEVGRQCSTIETLIFERCAVSSEIIAKILDTICSLKVLKLEFKPYSQNGVEDTNDPYKSVLSWSTLSEAIAAHKHSLERLYIVQNDANNWATVEYESELDTAEEDFLECLRDMQKLSYLDTGLRPLRTNPTGRRLEPAHFHDTLPASLEHLVIGVEEMQEPFTKRSLQASLQELAADCKLKFPLLQDVVVWLPEEEDNLFALDFSACKAAFESQNVHIRVLVREQWQWQLHPSTVTYGKEPFLLSSRSWGCELHKGLPDSNVRMHNTSRNLSPVESRVPIRFHGPCSAYHHPYGWSIIDEFGAGRS